MQNLVVAAAMLAIGSPLVDAAHKDALSLPAETCKYIRYLRIDEVPPADRIDVIKVLSGHCNHLSTSSELVPLLIVPGTDNALLRLDTRDYGWTGPKLALWDRLVSPYDHAVVEKITYEDEEWGYYDQYKRWISKGFKKTKKVVSKVTAIAPWLADTKERALMLGDLALRMGGTKAPILRGRWFFQQTAAAVDRNPNYYDFLGIKNERAFQELIGFDPRLDKRRIEIREAVANSGVTLQPRAIVRRDAVGGVYWYTLDFGRTIDKFDPLRILGRDIEDAFRDKTVKDVVRATEQYGTLPNGLWATGLFNEAGVIQATAPDSVASDSFAKSNDRRVHVNVGCTRCHFEGGLKPFGGWARNVFSPPLKLNATDYAKFTELRQQYLRHIEPFLARDRMQYTDAVKLLTGWDTKTYAAMYGSLWSGYVETPVTLEKAALDLGTTPQAFRKAIQTHIAVTGQTDLILGVFLLEGERAEPIPIQSWEITYSLAQQILRGIPAP